MSTPPHGLGQFPSIGKKKDKFTPELRILVASLLSMVIILLWAKYFGPKPPANQPQKEQPVATAPATAGSPANTTSGAPPANTVLSAPSAAPTAPPTGESQERTIVVENALYRVEFSNRGAVVKSWQLKK